jgi:hypothetical protein
VLDKLVAAPAAETTPAEPVKTEKAPPREAVVPQANKGLLDKLTRPAASPQTERAVPAEKPQTAPVETEADTAARRQQVRKNLLDELTGRTPPSGETKPVEKEDRENRDAKGK